MKLSYLKTMALLEGTSLILLLLVAMPLKYWMGFPEAVKIIGPLHGVLFIAFNLMLLAYLVFKKLTLDQAAIGSVASLIPFGTFVYKATTLKSIANEDASTPSSTS